MSNPTVCFLDMDGVLSDFVTAACFAHSKENPYLDVENHGATASMERLLGLTPEVFWSRFDESFWRDMPPTEYLKDIVSLVRQYFSKDGIYILTSPAFNPGCIDGKRDWLKKYVPDLSSHVVFTKHKHLCAAPGRILIDDFESNTSLFKEYGGDSFLFPTKHNRMHRFSDKPLAHLHHYLEALHTR